MSCFAEDHLHDFVDGLLESERTREVEEHLLSCASCRDTVDALRRLRDEVAELPQEIEPERDLWEGIRERIEAEKVVHGPFDKARERRARNTFRGTVAAAAAVVLVSVGAVIWALVGQGPGVGPGPGNRPFSGISGPQVIATAYGDASSSYNDASAAYEGAINDLFTVYEQRKEELPPEKVAFIEEQLGKIDEALTSVYQALEATPADQQPSAETQLALNRRKAKLNQEKVELLQKVAAEL